MCKAMLVSIVIRTYNEGKYLSRLLKGIEEQVTDSFEIETVIVDSGSQDATLSIAKDYNCRITYIKKSEFTFGRSLNIGCEFADGDYLIFISGHCIPASERWAENLIQPLKEEVCAYTYGRQLGHETTKFSECRLFDKHFPDYSLIPQNGFFCNNANAAISRGIWQKYQFDETLTGLEDMHLAKRLVTDNYLIGYVSEAPVYHIHDETWEQVKNRYEREAFALRHILPEMQFYSRDFVKYFIAGIYEDSAIALKQKKFLSEIKDIIMFRFMHYWGTFRGHHIHRQLSDDLKDKYFYPKDISQLNEDEEISETWNIK
jgi:glycosyltransferase involved in cell wall biosynthesis